jgi:hypothetical protein
VSEADYSLRRHRELDYPTFIIGDFNRQRSINVYLCGQQELGKGHEKEKHSAAFSEASSRDCCGFVSAE